MYSSTKTTQPPLNMVSDTEGIPPFQICNGGCCKSCGAHENVIPVLSTTYPGSQMTVRHLQVHPLNSAPFHPTGQPATSRQGSFTEPKCRTLKILRCTALYFVTVLRQPKGCERHNTISRKWAVMHFIREGGCDSVVRHQCSRLLLAKQGRTTSTTNWQKVLSYALWQNKQDILVWCFIIPGAPLSPTCKSQSYTKTLVAKRITDEV
jgi:hypothetical protein